MCCVSLERDQVHPGGVSQDSFLWKVVSHAGGLLQCHARLTGPEGWAAFLSKQRLGVQAGSASCKWHDFGKRLNFPEPQFLHL